MGWRVPRGRRVDRYPRPIVDDAPAADPEGPAPPSATAPPAVVAVVVTHDPGPWFEDSLQSFAAQDYPDLTVLVIDAGSAEDPTQRVAAACPSAFVRRLDANPGFGRAANEVLAMVEGASYLLLCHDDVGLAPDAVSALVAEAARTNAGLVGPKVTAWDRPRELLAVGMSVDRTGHPSSYVEAGEYDQGQHDGVRDVFFLPGGCQLVRADLFAALGGFDPGISFWGEDLDLCWRARVAGARIVVAPQARVRHRAELAERRPDLDTHRLTERHRLRTVLSCSGLGTLLWLAPVLAVLSLVDALAGLVTVRGGRFRAALGAWTWNLARTPQLLGRRRRLRGMRRVTDRDLAALRSRGLVRLQDFQTRDRPVERRSTVTTVRQGLVDFVRSGPSGVATAAWVVLGLALLVGSRHLITQTVPAVGELAAFPSGPSALWSEFTSGWRSAGLGSAAPAPTAFAALTGWGTAFLTFMGLARTALYLGLLPLGGLGAWRLLRNVGSVWGRITALTVYLVLPVAYDALAAASLQGVVAYAAAPFLLGGLARASGVAPFTPPPGEDGLVRAALGLGLVTAVAGLLLPSAPLLLVVMAVGIAFGLLLTGMIGGAGRVLGAGALGAVVAVVLQVPWSLDLVGGLDQGSLGLGAPATSLPLVDLLTFHTGPVRGGVVSGVAFLVLAALPVLVGRDWRVAWALRAWALAVTAWLLLWAQQVDWLSFPLPAPEVLLAPAAAGIALAAGLGAITFDEDVLGGGFTWRHLAVPVALVSLVVAAAPFLAAVGNGRWYLPRNDWSVALGFLDAEEADAPFRVLWIGDPEVLPLRGWELEEGTAFATSDNGLPDVTELFPGRARTGTDLLAEALRTATRRETNRLGDLLGPMGIRYVVVPERLAPEPFATEPHPLDPAVRDALASQLDLTQINVNPGVTLYENAAWTPVRAVVSEDAPTDFGVDVTDDAEALAAMARSELRPSRAALGDVQGPATYAGPVDGQGNLYLASGPGSGWTLSIDGEEAEGREAFGWATVFDLPRGGSATLSYPTPISRYLLIALQVGLWLFVISRVRRPARSPRPELPA